MKAKITKRTVDAVKPDPTRDVVMWDTTLKGFGLRVKPSGTKSFIAQYRNQEGRSRRYTLCQYGEQTPEEARKEAAKLLGQVAMGHDPAGVRASQREEPTFADLAARYLAEHAKPKKKPRSAQEDERMLDEYINDQLGTRKVYAIGREDVSKLHHKLREHPYQANKVLALLSKMFNLAEAWGYRQDGSNPCRHVQKYKEEKRRRYLSTDELMWLGRAMARGEDQEKPKDKISPDALLAIRLLLFTGARLNEILTLRWEHVDLEHGLLLLPDSKTGAKTIVLSTPALALLSARCSKTGWVIPGRFSDEHLNDLKKPWAKIKGLVTKLQDEEEAKGNLKHDDRVDISGLRVHDLRHTFASVGVSGGMGLPLIGGLLGHTQAQTTARYAHLADAPLKTAANWIGEEIDARLQGKEPAPVVEMRSR